MAVKGRFHRLSENHKRRITGKANAYSRAWTYFRAELMARVQVRIQEKLEAINELFNDDFIMEES